MILSKNDTESKNYNSKNIQKAFSEFLSKIVWVASDLNRGKMPLDVKTGRNASCSDPKTWSTFLEVDDYCRNRTGFAPAIALTEELGLICFDFDKCIDETGNPLAEVQSIVNRVASYSETSISGCGIHIFLRGKKPGTRCRHKNIEIYGKEKFLTLSGYILDGLDCIVNAQEALNTIYEEIFPKAQQEKTEVTTPRSPPLTDDEVTSLCKKAKNKDKFEALFDRGDVSGYYDDHSAADFALCQNFAFYTQNKPQIERLMQKSKLSRDKWSRSDYLKRTIESVLKGLTTVWQPKTSLQPMNTDLWEKPEKLEADDSLDIKFPLECLPIVLKEAVEEISVVNCADPALSAAVAIGMSGLSLGKKAKIAEKEDLFHYPSLFFVAVLPSGERKSKIFHDVISGIDQAIEQEERLYEGAKVIIEANNKAVEELESQIRKQLREGRIDKKTAQKELESLFKDRMQLPEHPCNFGDDLTPARLFQKIADHSGVYGIFSGEGRGILKKILKGSQDGDSGESIYLSGCWGDRIARSRVGCNKDVPGGEDIIVRSPALTIVSFVQPDVWEDFSKDKTMRQSGLISRINVIIPKTQIGTRLESPNDKKLDKAKIEKYTEIILRIRKWNPEITQIIELSPEAADRRREFFNAIESELGPNGIYEDVKDIATKSISLCARLALIFHVFELASFGDLPKKETLPRISEETWLKAQSVQEYFLAQAIDSQRTHSKTGPQHLLYKTADWLQKRTNRETPDYITESHIIKFVRGSSEATVEPIITTLMKSGWLRLAGRNRQKSLRYEVNPKIYEL